MRLLTVLLAVVLWSGLGLAQQNRDARSTPPAPVRGQIAGTVIAADSSRPVRRVSVTLSGVTLSGMAPRITRSVQTDDQGAFSFPDLPGGDYSLTAAKGGFIESIYGQKLPGSGRPGTPLRLAEGQKITSISIPIARGAVITGTIVDETGEPAFGLGVRALRWSMQSGQRTLTPAGVASTDDRGVYRIHSLLPGEYVISAAPGSAGLAELGRGAPTSRPSSRSPASRLVSMS